MKSTALLNSESLGINLTNLRNAYPSGPTLAVVITGETGGGVPRFQRRARATQMFWDARWTGVLGATVVVTFNASVNDPNYETGLLVWYSYG